MDEQERSRRRRQTEPYKAYQRDYQREYYHQTKAQKTPEQREAKRRYLREYRQKNRVAVAKKQRAAERKRLYGLTEEQFQALLEQQDWECAICTRLLISPVVDHDHWSGKVRGLLCRKCNAAIGLLEDNPGLLMTAAEYVIRSWSGANSTTSSVQLSEL